MPSLRRTPSALTHPSRLEGLSDATFAIVLTLASEALGQVPRGGAGAADLKDQHPGPAFGRVRRPGW